MPDATQLTTPAKSPEEAKLRREKILEWEARENIDYSKEAGSLMEGLNMSEFDKKRENDAKSKVAELEAQEGSPEEVLAQLDGEQIGAKGEIATGTVGLEMIDGENDRSEKKETGRSSAKAIRERISKRGGEEAEGKNSETGREIKSLDTTEARTENTQTAKKLFFSDENLNKQIELTTGGDTKDKKAVQEWVGANLGEQGVLSESFKAIQGNFVMPAGIEGENMAEIYSKNPDRIGEINEALSDAVELEVTKVTNGKVNYDTVAVDQLINNMRDIQCGPLQKMQEFGKICTHVNTSIGKGGKKLTEAFRKKQALSAEAQGQERNFQEQKIAQLQKNNNQSEANKVTQEPTKEKESINSGDIFTASDIDLANPSSETYRESA